jgi:hypothetical protein
VSPGPAGDAVAEATAAPTSGALDADAQEAADLEASLRLAEQVRGEDCGGVLEEGEKERLYRSYHVPQFVTSHVECHVYAMCPARR